MKTYTQTSIKAALGIALMIALTSGPRLQAQVSYTYDAAGNPTAANLAASSAPSITAPPQAATIQPNGVVTFSVVAAGPGLAYQWLSNGVIMGGATNDTLVLSNLPLVGTNLGNFSVVVRNSSGSVVSAAVPLWTDANANGIPDWWELLYFGNLSQTADGDYDGDGVNNLDEFLEGTNPADPTSFNPRLKVAAAHGTVTISPLRPYYTMGQPVTLTATPDAGHQFVQWAGSVIGTKPQITVIMSTNQSITGIFGLPLASSLDNTNLAWTTGGNALWFGQAEVSHDGIGSAQSGPIVSMFNSTNEGSLSGSYVGEQTWLQTTPDLNQPMQLSFWWSVSSEAPDALSFAIDSVTNYTISGTGAGWQLVQTNLAVGRHTLTWTYTKGPVDLPTGLPFTDAGWIDQVTIVNTNAVQSPLLSISAASPNNILISWPAPSTGFILQQTASLANPNWLAATNAVNVVSGQNQAVTAPSGASQFYRLMHP